MSKQIAYFDTVTNGYSGKITTANSVLTTDADGAVVDSFAVNGSGVLPASTTTKGWTVTTNYAGFGEVDFWSTVNSDLAGGQGFYFYQKLSAGTTAQLAALFGDNTFAQVDIYGGGNTYTQYVDAATATIETAGGSGIPISYLIDSAVKVSVTKNNGVKLVGTTTNDDAAALYVGEYIKSNIAVGSAVSITTATAKTIASVSLTAGDWDVTGTVAFNPSAGTLIVDMKGGISQTNNTLPTLSDTAALVDIPLSPSAGVGATIPVGTSRVSLAATTTVYLVAQSTFTVSTNTAYGFISARRVR